MSESPHKSDKKLTPRVGDRVLFKDAKGVTQAGNVVGFSDRQVGPDEWHRMAEIQVGWGISPEYAYEADLTVVDREPVEWPEGCSKFSEGMVGIDGRLFTRAEIQQILTVGPDMLARWDELMRGEA